MTIAARFAPESRRFFWVVLVASGVAWLVSGLVLLLFWAAMGYSPDEGRLCLRMQAILSAVLAAGVVVNYPLRLDWHRTQQERRRFIGVALVTSGLAWLVSGLVLLTFWAATGFAPEEGLFLQLFGTLGVVLATGVLTLLIMWAVPRAGERNP
jgi:hypothetical protein